MDLQRDRTRWSIAFLSLAGCLALLALVHYYSPPAMGLWLETFYNSAHVLVFAIIAPALFLVLRSLIKLRFLLCILAAGGIAVLLGLLSEFAQIAGPRDASFEDLLADWLGAISGLLLVVASRHGQHGRTNRQIVWAIAGFALMTIALRSLIVVSAAYVERNNALPSLFDYDLRFGSTFLRLQHSTLEEIPSSSGERSAGKVTLQDGAWPGLVFHDIWPDWREYTALLIELEMDAEEPLEIHVRLHDYMHTRGSQPFSDRFNMPYVLKSGNQTIRIPIEKIQNAPKRRQMDIARIDTLVIFATRAESGRSFNLVEIRLEQ